MTFNEFLENLKYRGYKENEISDFILFGVSDEQAEEDKTIGEWNIIFDRFVFANILTLEKPQ
jgi:hypothetical protein